MPLFSILIFTICILIFTFSRYYHEPFQVIFEKPETGLIPFKFTNGNKAYKLIIKFPNTISNQPGSIAVQDENDSELATSELTMTTVNTFEHVFEFDQTIFNILASLKDHKKKN